MPVVRVNKSEEEGFSAAEELTVRGEVARVTTNMRLAEHIGQFVAGEVTRQFQNEDLADALKGKNMWMVSGSWG